MKKRFAVTFLAVGLLVGMVGIVESGQPATTSMQVPLTATVWVPLADGSLDEVALSGMVHVVTHVTPPDPYVPPDPYNPAVRIRVNLDQVSGFGSPTGFRYEAVGTNRINLPSSPPDPIRVSFDMRATRAPDVPPDPLIPLDVNLRLTFNPDLGLLTNVTIESVSVPVP